MAKAKMEFRPFEYDALPQEIKDSLAVIDAEKAKINTALAAMAGNGLKAQHSYKLDFAAGKRVFKIAFYKPAAAKVEAKPVFSGSLQDWIASQVGNGRAV